MFRLFKSAKVAPEPPPAPPPPRLEIHISTRSQDIWNQFANEVEATNENIDYTTPGPLSIELAELCERRGAEQLDSEKIMYFAETTNYLLELKRNGERIGFLLLDCEKSPYSKAKIWLVCISSSEKGKGYAKLLIDQAIQIAKSAGKKTIHLEAISRQVGRKVYRPMGFDFNSPDDDDMTKDIEIAENKAKNKTRRSRRSRRNQKGIKTRK